MKKKKFLVSEKLDLMLNVGFELSRVPGRRRNEMYVPKKYCPEIGSTGIEQHVIGKIFSFDDAWQRYLQFFPLNK